MAQIEGKMARIEGGKVLAGIAIGTFQDTRDDDGAGNTTTSGLTVHAQSWSGRYSAKLTAFGDSSFGKSRMYLPVVFGPAGNLTATFGRVGCGISGVDLATALRRLRPVKSWRSITEEIERFETEKWDCKLAIALVVREQDFDFFNLEFVPLHAARSGLRGRISWARSEYERGQARQGAAASYFALGKRSVRRNRMPSASSTKSAMTKTAT
jgi:hypothetical protein